MHFFIFVASLLFVALRGVLFLFLRSPFSYHNQVSDLNYLWISMILFRKKILTRRNIIASDSFWFIILFPTFIFFSCELGDKKENGKSSKDIEILESLSSDSISLVYFMTSWCEISNKVLAESISVVAQNDSFKVIVLCGNNDQDFVNTLREKYSNCKIHLISKASNISPFIDRMNIKKFIRTNFQYSEKLKLEGSFMIPVSFYVNSHFKILDDAPQNVHMIKDYMRAYKVKN